MDENISADALRRAAAIQDKIESLRAEIGTILSEEPGTASGGRPLTRPQRKKRKMSAQARARIAAAQRKRWARGRAGK